MRHITKCLPNIIKNEIELVQSHGGSGSQARSVIEGNDADVVTLALAHDITAIEEAGLIEEGWMDEFEKNSSPYTSTIVFLVHSGNEKGIKDWDDLTEEGVEIITPDPKSSGGACWNFLAAWQYAKETFGGDETKMKDFVSKVYDNVLVMDSGARGATTTFVENGQGDVLIAWENEALLTLQEYPGEYELVTPSISILAEPSVAIVDENADKNGTQETAKAYLEYLYTQDAQRLAGTHFYRMSRCCRSFQIRLICLSICVQLTILAAGIRRMQISLQTTLFLMKSIVISRRQQH